MTNQEAFTKSATHLLAQGMRATDIGANEGQCRYRNQQGLMCAIGCLIPDDKYHPKMEGLVLEQQPENFTFLDDVDQSLLEALQTVHDVKEPEEWRAELEEVAEDFNLEMPPRE